MPQKVPNLTHNYALQGCSFLFLELPNGDVSVIAARSQESRLLWVPGHTVNILVVSSGHLSSQ